MDWQEIKSELFRLSSPPRSVTTIAVEIGVNRATVYRWLRNDQHLPHPIVRRHVERVIEEIKQKSP
jgi:transposase-like protein